MHVYISILLYEKIYPDENHVKSNLTFIDVNTVYT